MKPFSQPINGPKCSINFMIKRNSAIKTKPVVFQIDKSCLIEGRK